MKYHAILGHGNGCHAATAYWRFRISGRCLMESVRCRAWGCIQDKVSMRLSSSGCFLYVPLILTCSCHSLFVIWLYCIISTMWEIVKEFVTVHTGVCGIFVTVQASWPVTCKNPLKIASRWDFCTPESCSYGLCIRVQRPARTITL